jgi:hypothetical protein
VVPPEQKSVSTYRETAVQQAAGNLSRYRYGGVRFPTEAKLFSCVDTDPEANHAAVKQQGREPCLLPSPSGAVPPFPPPSVIFSA